MIDVDALERWLADVGDEPDDIGRIAAALPDLIAVFRAARALRDADETDAMSNGGIRSPSLVVTDALCNLYNAVDTANGRDDVSASSALKAEGGK